MSSPVLWYTTRATGLVALILLSSTMVVGILTANRLPTRRWPGFAQQDLHKRLSIVSLVFVGIHVLTSVLDTYVDIGWPSILLPFTSDYDRLWIALGTISVDLMSAVALSSFLRPRIKASLWRSLHWLAYLSWPVALAHAFGTGTDMSEPWAMGLGATCIASVACALAVRIGTGITRRRRALALATAPVVARYLPPGHATRRER